MGCDDLDLAFRSYEKSEQEKASAVIREYINYVYRKLDNPKKISEKLQKPELVPILCELLKSLTPQQFEKIVYNAHDPFSRKLADWWEKHLEEDLIRLAKKAKEQIEWEARRLAIDRINEADRKILGLAIMKPYKSRDYSTRSNLFPPVYSHKLLNRGMIIRQLQSICRKI